LLAHEQVVSGPSTLDLKLATSNSRPDNSHVLILCHGLPRALGMGRQAAGLLPELAEHLANESGWLVATGTLSGVGASTGSFSATQWRHDLATIVERVHESDRRVALAGFGFGGALALSHAATDERIRGVATFAAPAHMDRWMGERSNFRDAIRTAGVVADEKTLPSADELYDDVMSIDPLGAIATIPPRRLLVVHGADDVEVPSSEARELVQAADGRAELRIIQGAAHQMRADPRMVATLLGWLDRYR
jgi:uncharacterized protein